MGCTIATFVKFRENMISKLVDAEATSFSTPQN